MTVKRKGIYIATLEKKENSSVEYGTRPVVVLQNDKGNLHSPTTIIAPITSQLGKHRIPPHVYLQNPVLEKESIVLLEQIQTIDQKQIVEYLGDATAGEMSKIEQAVRISLGMNREDTNASET